MNNSRTNSVLYLSHGGGPLPLLGDPGHLEMVNFLKTLSSNIKKPSAIIVISAHWEEPVVTITSGHHPKLIYDYYGFPESAYNIQYPAPGHSELAHEIFAMFEIHDIVAKLDDQRGFDHGLYVPLKIMYPEAEIPCIQISLVKGLDPLTHIKIGEALSTVNLDNVLILGSGFSFHNMQAFFQPESPNIKHKNEAFETWLIDCLSNPSLSEDERKQRLMNWSEAPYARYCHPREEHLIPLHVCYGATLCACTSFFELNILNKKTSMYLWR